MSHPSLIVENAVAALNNADWSGFIKLCDPVSIRRFKSDLVWQFSDHGYSEPLTAEDFMSDMPEMPREVAEYNVAEMERYGDPARRLSLEIDTVSSVQELNELEPEEVLLRWLQARMPFSVEGFPVPSPADEIGTVSHWRPRYAVLGSVRDGPDFAHVVCRRVEDYSEDEEGDDDFNTPRDEAELTRALGPISGLPIATCRRQADGSWRLVADRNLFVLACMSIDEAAES